MTLDFKQEQHSSAILLLYPWNSGNEKLSGLHPFPIEMGNQVLFMDLELKNEF